ncbi:hypothetical protein BKA93DRAFT_784313 [Sparassis latifolia]
MPKARQVTSSEPSEEESDQQYNVELVTKARVDKNKKWEFWVKWENYPWGDNTWEPEENLRLTCNRLLNSFWDHVGRDHKGLPKGYVLEAKKSWVAAEQAYFRKMMGGNEESQSQKDSSESENEQTRGRNKRARSRTTSPPTSRERKKKKRVKTTTERKNKQHTESADETDISDDLPLTSRPRKRAKPSAGVSDSTEKPPRKIPKVSRSLQDERSTPSTSIKGKGKEKIQLSVQTSHLDSDLEDSLFSSPSSPDVSLSAKILLPESSARVAGGEKPILPSKDISRKPQERRGIKELPIELKDTGAGGISTKLRLARGLTSSRAQPSIPPAQKQKSALAGLSFRKTSLGNNILTPTAESPTAGQMPSISRPSLRINPTKPAASPSVVSPIVQSPFSAQSSHNDFPAAGFSPTESISHTEASQPGPVAPSHRRPLPLPRRSVAMPSVPQPPSVPLPTVEPTAEVDQFLSTIMPPELAALLQETNGEDTLPLVRASTNTIATTKQPSIGRIPKKWKWSGELFLDINPEKADLLCTITLHDATDPLPNGLRFSICLILQACTQVQQFAKLSHREQEDEASLTTLANYMRKNLLFTYAHLYLDNIAVALLLVFPSASSEICALLRVPSEIANGAALVAALIPWVLTASEYEAASWRKPRSKLHTQSLGNEPYGICRKILNDPILERSLRMLNFSKPLREFMSQPNRPYCIWCSPAEGDPSLPALETASLRTILNKCKAVDVGTKKDVRAIFVHVGALASLRKLPALALRRQKRPDLRFLTYGTHETVPPERWGIREIYPLGGVVTFTPCAIIEDLLGVLELIKKLNEHPLWDCYVLPSVVAMVAKLTCQGQSPLSLFDRGELIFDELLDLIAGGKVSLLQAPPLTRQPQRDNDSALRWISWQFRILSSDARVILEESIKLAVELYRIPEAELPLQIEKEIEQDMLSMQLQPAIMDGYRRFVVIHGGGDRHLVNEDHAIECVRLSNFDFKDDYFLKASSNDNASGKT